MSRRISKPKANAGGSDGDTGTTSGDRNDVASTVEPNIGVADPARTVDPSSVGGNNGNDADDNNASKPKRGRGRPAGSSNKIKSVPLGISGVEKVLIGIHTSLSLLTGIDELAMGDAEAHEIAQASSDLMRHYGGGALDQKTIDWLNFLQAIGIAYGGRMLAVRARKRVAPSNVVPLRAVPSENKLERDAANATIPGIGAVQFPPGHDLNPARKQ